VRSGRGSRRAPKRGKAERGKRAAPTKKPARAVRTKKSRTSERSSKKTVQKTKPTIVKAPVSTKTALRARLRAARAQLSAAERRTASARVTANLAAMRWFRVSGRVACYLTSDGEVDTGEIIERLWRMRKDVFLPVLSRLRHDRLWFAPAIPGMKLVPNRYGIPEPHVETRELVRAQELDLVLLPLVAFDKNGNRLGRGAGFYDRSLAFLRHRRYLRTPRTLGLAYDFQRVPKIAADPWDVALDGVVTDRSVYYTGL
jgi:5-formyltetrahydrofolate cyclo-ligase